MSIKKKAVLLLCGVFSLVGGKLFAQDKSDKPVHVLITAGQSNTDGRVPNKFLPDEIKSLTTDTSYLTGAYPYAKIVQNSHTGQFKPYWPKGRISEGFWTYDAITYRLFGEAVKEDFYVIKYAVGGTSIGYPKEMSPKGGYWSGNPQWLAQTTSREKKGHSLLLSFTETIDAAIDQTLSKLDRGYQIDAFLWHQGESDKQYEADYYDNLKAVIQYVRQHLTEKTGQDYSRLPFVFGSIPKANRYYSDLVEAAMQRIAEEDENAYLVDLSQQTLQGDRTHFDAPAAEYFGRKMYGVLEQVLGLSKAPFHVAKYSGDKTCAISYTFDDGLAEHYSVVAPRLKALGFKGTFWINGAKVNQDEQDIVDTTRVTWGQLKAMAEEGHEISNHGWNHRNLGRFSLEEIKEDVLHNDSMIYEKVGVWPRTYCYPNNTKRMEGIAFINQNRVGTRLLQRSVGGKSTKENLHTWVQDLLANKGWGVTMTHGIHYGYDHFSNPDILWTHLQEVKQQENQIWVGTFEEVVSYMKERKNTTFKITQTADGYRLEPHLTLDQELFAQPLTGVWGQEEGKSVQIEQDGKPLAIRQSAGKVLFDFNPFGGVITVKQHRN